MTRRHPLTPTEYTYRDHRIARSGDEWWVYGPGQLTDENPVYATGCIDDAMGTIDDVLDQDCGEGAMAIELEVTP